MSIYLSMILGDRREGERVKGRARVCRSGAGGSGGVLRNERYLGAGLRVRYRVRVEMGR